jgi:hypothetical protein
MRKAIGLTAFFVLFSLAVAGIAPASKIVTLANNEVALAYFTVSQGSPQPMSVQVKISGPAFATLKEGDDQLLNLGEEGRVIVSINANNAQPGTYNAYLIDIISAPESGVAGGGLNTVIQEAASLTIIVLNPDGSQPTRTFDYPRSIEAPALPAPLPLVELQQKRADEGKPAAVTAAPQLGSSSSTPNPQGVQVIGEPENKLPYYAGAAIGILALGIVIYERFPRKKEHKPRVSAQERLEERRNEGGVIGKKLFD